MSDGEKLNWAVVEGDCLTVMRGLPAGYFSALVTDPPAAIGFRGKEWDSDRGGRSLWIAWLVERLREAIRVLKPGSHALVWALPRTAHWTQTAVEDAGFEVRDVVVHLFGDGRPRSRQLLKPASEHWILARAPGKGAGIDVEACRVPWLDEEDERESKGKNQHESYNNGVRQGTVYGAETALRTNYDAPGRWPVNAVLDEAVAAELGRPARFFYVPKPTSAERDVGLGGVHNEHPTVKSIGIMRWLVKLVSRPGDAVLDPFCGSGGTGIACAIEGRHFMGVEEKAEYAAAARARIAHWAATS